MTTDSDLCVSQMKQVMMVLCNHNKVSIDDCDATLHWSGFFIMRFLNKNMFLWTSIWETNLNSFFYELFSAPCKMEYAKVLHMQDLLWFYPMIRWALSGDFWLTKHWKEKIYRRIIWDQIIIVYHIKQWGNSEPSYNPKDDGSTFICRNKV